MDLVEFVKKNADKLNDLPDIASLVEKLAAKMKELGHAPLANDISDSKKPEYMPTVRFDEVVAQKNELKTQVGELTGQIDSLKKAAEGNEALTKQIEELQQHAKDADERVKNTTLDSAIKVAAIAAKANDPADVLAFVDKSKLIVDGDKVVGLDDQIKSLQESKAYLFATEDKKVDPKGGGEFGGGNNGKTEPETLRDAIAAKYNV